MREWSIPGTSSWTEDMAIYYHRIGKIGWQARKAQRVLPIHYVSYELNPHNWSKLTDPTEQEIVDNFILERGGVDALISFASIVTKIALSILCENVALYWSYEAILEYLSIKAP
ncbi:hypothetical protein GcC1_183024b [Golovinomyces cichoracearum]|uniref:Uncharacterized protein n=1 Tax=Golovinomyces cichoracearum TaxID=62708 RepID=A0A420HLW0_9PEZI|nr:hypothetical protein GcC1_183024b [Golovinomyces cichoracearum]